MRKPDDRIIQDDHFTDKYCKPPPQRFLYGLAQMMPHDPRTARPANNHDLTLLKPACFMVKTKKVYSTFFAGALSRFRMNSPQINTVTLLNCGLPPALQKNNNNEKTIYPYRAAQNRHLKHSKLPIQQRRLFEYARLPLR